MEAVVAAIGIIMTIVDHMVEMAVVTAATVNLYNIQIHITYVNSYFIKPQTFSQVTDKMLLITVNRWRTAG